MVAAAPRERPTAYLRYVRVRRAAVVISASPARAAEGGGPYDVTNQNRTYGGDLCPAAAAPQRNPAAHRWPPYIGCGADSPECSVWIGGVLRGSSRTPTLTKERAILTSRYLPLRGSSRMDQISFMDRRDGCDGADSCRAVSQIDPRQREREKEQQASGHFIEDGNCFCLRYPTAMLSSLMTAMTAIHV